MCTHLPKTNEKRSHHAGFTLVELMVVTGFISLAAAIAVPSYMQWYTRYQLKQAIIELQGSLNLTRIAAMNRNTTINVGIGMAVDPADGKNKVTVTFGTVLPTLRMSPTVTSVTAPATIPFTSLGLIAATANQTIMLTNSQGVQYSATVTPGGKVMWCAKATCP